MCCVAYDIYIMDVYVAYDIYVMDVYVAYDLLCDILHIVVI